MSKILKNIRDFHVRLQPFFAKHRIWITAICCTCGPLCLTLVFRELYLRPYAFILIILFLLSQLLIVLVSFTPSRYANIELLSLHLPSIHNALKLDNEDRITIHHISNAKRDEYELLTPYHPTKFDRGRGRVYKFSSGIVGRCFKRKKADAYAIPESKSLKEAMEDDWSFTDYEIAHLTQDRRSFLAIPIGEEGPYAKAVLYMDSPNPEKFSKENLKNWEEKIEKFLFPLLKIITE